MNKPQQTLIRVIWSLMRHFDWPLVPGKCFHLLTLFISTFVSAFWAFTMVAVVCRCLKLRQTIHCDRPFSFSSWFPSWRRSCPPCRACRKACPSWAEFGRVSHLVKLGLFSSPWFPKRGASRRNPIESDQSQGRPQFQEGTWSLQASPW